MLPLFREGKGLANLYQLSGYELRGLSVQSILIAADYQGVACGESALASAGFRAEMSLGAAQIDVRSDVGRWGLNGLVTLALSCSAPDLSQVL